MQDLIGEFMAQKRFAIVGATDNPNKYGNEIFRDLRSRGYEVYAVNSRLEELEGVKCYPSLSDVPVKVDVVNIVVPPQAAREVVEEARQLGLGRIWLQPGAESQAVLEYCQENGLRVVHDVCVMMSGPKVRKEKER